MCDCEIRTPSEPRTPPFVEIEGIDEDTRLGRAEGPAARAVLNFTFVDEHNKALSDQSNALIHVVEPAIFKRQEYCTPEAGRNVDVLDVDVIQRDAVDLVVHVERANLQYADTGCGLVLAADHQVFEPDIAAALHKYAAIDAGRRRAGVAHFKGVAVVGVDERGRAAIRPITDALQTLNRR